MAERESTHQPDPEADPEVDPEADDANPLRPAGIPEEIGGYRIHRVLGSGGMATVYAGLQKQPRRTVAIKVMRATGGGKAALRRFKREIEILGRLRHRFIAQVYAAGVHDDGGGAVPYFVMEYVPGARTIDEYADRRGLSLRDRLKLFVKVCAAVEHGHRNKIIHRDLKPGNILIDETGEPKVIDFGVARAVEVDVSAQTMQTEVGGLIGTLRYMAPEQLDRNLQDLDARCDVYALGVLLYKLTTGHAAFELTGLPVLTAMQVIREDQPMRPSTRRAELKGDLETIILRAIDKDRTRRYRSAGSLGRDLVRFLADKPIKARDAGLVYRGRLFLRRHRTESLAAAVVATVIVIAAGVVLWQRSTMHSSAPSPAASTGGRMIATPSVAGTVTPETPAVVEVPPGYTLGGGGRPAPTALAFGSAGRLVAGAWPGPSIHVWDLDTRALIMTTADHDAPVRMLAFDATGSRLASLAADDSIVVVERTPADATRVLLRTTVPGAGVMTLRPGGDLLAVACDDLTVRLLGADGVETRRLRATRGGFEALAFGPGGGRLATGSERGGISVWDVETGERRYRFTDLDEPVLAVGFADRGRRVVAVSADGRGGVWSLEDDGARVASFRLALESITTVVIAPDGRWLIAAAADAFQAYRLPDGSPVDAAVLRLGGTTRPPLALTPDGRWYALPNADGAIAITPIAARWE